MLKIFAAAIIIAASSRIGFILASRLDKRKNSLEGFKDALSMLEGEIGFMNNPPPQAFRNIALSSVRISGFFESVCENLECGQTSVSSAWNEALDKSRAKMCLKSEDIRALAEFGTRFGKSDVKNELNNINNAMIKLNMQLAEAKNECDGSKKMYRSAGVLCGILAAVLLI